MNHNKNWNVCASPWQEMIIDLTGEVMPCCFWTGYGNTGKPLGNTNESTIDEIWNGEAYRDLRKRNASGDLDGHPCGNCMAARWANGQFPKFRWPAGFTKEQGYCFFGIIPEDFQEAIAGSDETIMLCEDGVPLPLADEKHAAIRQQGCGRYSLWNGWLYFSTSDNSDPAHNGRRYELRCGEIVKQLGSLKKDSLSGKNLLNAYDEYLVGKEEMNAKPSMISLISTADCNIDCPGCSQNTVRLANVQHRPETVPDVLAHVPFVHQFIWHGGEPYLIKRFRQFIDEFKTGDNPNLTFGFTSNGTMITEKEAKKLKKFPRINASVSVDSFNKESFEKIRAGADYDAVMKNLFRLLQDYSAPERVYSVGMIICKSNMLELADNLRFAIAHDIALNLSPVVVYPVTEQLDVFMDFESQSRGWEDVINEAAAVVAEAKSRNKPSVLHIDPSGMVEEIRNIYLQAKGQWSDLLTIKVVVDSSDGLKGMRKPGLIVKKQDRDLPLAYLPLTEGQREYRLCIPKAELHGEKYINWYLVHDLNEPMGTIDNGVFRDKGGDYLHAHAFQNISRELDITVPNFHAPAYIPNIRYANYGESTPEGLHVRVPEEIELAYRKKKERYASHQEFNEEVVNLAEMSGLCCDMLQQLHNYSFGSKGAIVEISAALGASTCALASSLSRTPRKFIFIKADGKRGPLSENYVAEEESCRDILRSRGDLDNITVAEQGMHEALEDVSEILNGEDIGLLYVDFDGDVEPVMQKLVACMQAGCIVVFGQFLEGEMGKLIRSYVKNAIESGLLEALALTEGGAWIGRLTCSENN